MKRKIILTGVIVMIYIGVNMLLNIGSYSASQNYAQIAAQQVNDDSAYYALKTQSTVTDYMWLVKIGLILIGTFCMYLVWKPKAKPTEVK